MIIELGLEFEHVQSCNSLCCIIYNGPLISIVT